MTARLGQLLEFTGKKEGGLEPEFEPRDALGRRQSLGELLRQTRERYRQDLETVSAELRIRLVYLRAIEDDRFDLLPGPTYASGFLRSYAEYLGLNSKDVIRRYREEMAQFSANEQPPEPAEVVERRFPVRAVVVGVVGLVVVAVGWRALSGTEDGVFGTIAGIPARIEALIVGPEPAVEAPPTDLAATASAETEIATMPPARETTPVGGPDTSQRGPFGVFASVPVTEPVEVSVSVIAANGLPVPPMKPAAPTVAAVVEAGAAPTPMVVADATLPSSEVIPTTAPQAADTGAAAPQPTTPPSQESVIAAVPTVPSVAAPAPAAPPASDGVAAVAAVPAAPAAPEVAPAGSSAAAAGGSSNLNALAAIPAVPSDSLSGTRSQTFGATNAGSRVLLYARLESWIQVTDADNVPLWTRVLRAGDSYLLPDQPGLTLATGNAGGLDIFVDGKKIPSLGPVGVERRGVVLDPARLTTGTAGP